MLQPIPCFGGSNYEQNQAQLVHTKAPNGAQSNNFTSEMKNAPVRDSREKPRV